MKAFANLLSTNVEVIKSSPIMMDSKKLLSYTEEVISTIKNIWVKFTWHSHLPSKSLSTLSWWVQDKPEVHSFALGKWFINVNSEWSVYYKNNNKTLTIWRMNSDTWTVEFNKTSDIIINDIIKWQSEKLVVKAGE